MRFSNIYKLKLAMPLALFLLAGCPPEPIPEPKDELGCIRPVSLVGMNGAEVKLLKSGFKDFTFGGIDVKTSPEVFQALQAGARDALLHEYLICRAQKQGFITNGQQANHVRSKLQFMVTAPTAEQYSKWEAEHPYPSN